MAAAVMSPGAQAGQTPVGRPTGSRAYPAGPDRRDDQRRHRGQRGEHAGESTKAPARPLGLDQEGEQHQSGVHAGGGEQPLLVRERQPGRQFFRSGPQAEVGEDRQAQEEDDIKVPCPVSPSACALIPRKLTPYQGRNSETRSRTVLIPVIRSPAVQRFGSNRNAGPVTYPAWLAAGPAVPAGLTDWAGLAGPGVVSRVPQRGQAITPSRTSLPHSVQNMVVCLSLTACYGRVGSLHDQPTRWPPADM